MRAAMCDARLVLRIFRHNATLDVRLGYRTAGEQRPYWKLALLKQVSLGRVVGATSLFNDIDFPAPLAFDEPQGFEYHDWRVSGGLENTYVWEAARRARAEQIARGGGGAEEMSEVRASHPLLMLKQATVDFSQFKANSFHVSRCLILLTTTLTLVAAGLPLCLRGFLVHILKAASQKVQHRLTP